MYYLAGLRILRLQGWCYKLVSHITNACYMFVSKQLSVLIANYMPQKSKCIAHQPLLTIVVWWVLPSPLYLFLQVWDNLPFNLLLIDLYILLFPVNTMNDVVQLDQLPTAYNNSPTNPGAGCAVDSSAITCRGFELLGDMDLGSADLDTSKVLAWNREINIVIERTQSTRVNQVNLFFYNIPSSGVGLPPVELYWSTMQKHLSSTSREPVVPCHCW